MAKLSRVTTDRLRFGIAKPQTKDLRRRNTTLECSTLKAKVFQRMAYSP
jgi:hypothetical protein